MSITNNIPSSTLLPPTTTTRVKPTSNPVESLLSPKRKRSQVAAPSSIPTSTTAPLIHEQFRFVITLEPDALTHDDAPRSFRSLFSILRSQFPIMFLESSDASIQKIKANLPPLEGDILETSSQEPRLLIVQEEHGPLFAVEKVKSSVYSLLRLADWVKAHHITDCGPGLTNRHANKPKDSHQHEQAASSWWHTCLLPSPEDIGSLESARKAPRLSMMASDLLKREQNDNLPRDQPLLARNVSSPVAIVGTEPEAADASVEDVLTRFIAQYLDTLYLSRTPLAFFAKGPVSRLRAAFSAGTTGTHTLANLVPFLKDMIMPSSSADKKYKDKLPEILTKVPLQDLEDEQTSQPKEKKKRRKRRLKPDKYGIMQDEGEHFAKWWHGNDAASGPADETADRGWKRRSAQLRTRETFMQLILILEVLSLEVLPEVMPGPTNEALPGPDELQSKPDEAQSKPRKGKSKKGHDLALLLELLMDKLCIWHSLDTDSILNDSSEDPKDRKSADELRDFCIEVIIPFYQSRVPAHAAHVNKKLGGPAPSSTTTKGKAGGNSHRSRPGDPETRHPRQDVRPDKASRNSLHRVATEIAGTASKFSDPPTLRHSVTDPQQFKREASETPSLSRIPSFRASQQPPSRRASGVSLLRAREVDFTALAAANDAKQKKKREVEEKLRDAISVLKRPNRATVGKEIADVAEQRRIMANARARGATGNASRGKGRDVRQQADQEDSVVAATPKGGHVSQSLIAATPHHIAAPSFLPRTAGYSQSQIPSSGPSYIPSSTQKPASTLLSRSFPQDHSRTGGLQYSIAEVEEDTLVPATGRRQRVVRYEIEEKTDSSTKASKSKGTVGFTDVADFATAMDKTSAVPSTIQRSRRTMSPLLGDFDDHDDDNEDEDERGFGVVQTPSKPSRSFHIHETSSKSTNSRRHDTGAAATAAPIKKPISSKLEKSGRNDHDNQCQQDVLSGSAMPDNNIYDALGWNDDFSD